MKFRITEKGAHAPGDQPLPVGTIVELDSDEVPAFLVNKGVLLTSADSEDAEFIVNPSSEPEKTGEDSESQDDEEDTTEEAEDEPQPRRSRRNR